MPRFVARPVVIEAHPYDGNADIMPFDFRRALTRFLPDGTVQVTTGDGLRVAKHGDWIARGPDGVFSVLKPSTFETMYQLHVAAPPIVGLQRTRKETVNG